MVYPALLPLVPLMRTPRLPVVDWTDPPHQFKWTCPFRWKTKSGFCVCAITFQTCSNNLEPTSVTCLCQLHLSIFKHKKKKPSTYESVRNWNLICNVFITFCTFSLQHELAYSLVWLWNRSCIFCMDKVVIKKLQFTLFPSHPCCVFFCYSMLNFSVVLLEWTEWLADSKIGVGVEMAKNALCLCAIL